MLSALPLSPRSDQLLMSRAPITANRVDEAQQTVSELFCEHTLTPIERREVRMSLKSAHDADVGIEVLDYGEAVRIHVDQGLEDFHLVQLPLSGQAMMQVGQDTVQSSAAVATLPPVDREFTMRWAANTPTFILYASRERLQAIARQMYGSESAEHLELALEMQMKTREGTEFLRALLEWHEVMEQTCPNSGYVRKLSSELLLARMLGAVEHSASESSESLESTTVAHPDALATRFMNAIEEGAEFGVGVLEIADQLNVPLRTLQAHVRASFGSTPSALLREARLQRARKLLIEGDPTVDTVTALAQACGFGHLGRFSSEYRIRFGETPAQTLRR